MLRNKQEIFWSGEFGKSYANRNSKFNNQLDEAYKALYGVSRTSMNETFLGSLPKDIRILEIGCSTGTQLKCLQSMGFSSLYGIEIQECAVNEANKLMKDINIIQGSAFELPFEDEYFDLIFTSGVLIHIDPEYLPKILSEIYRCTKKYIWGFEYFSENLTPLDYRGNKGFLWKANYKEMMTTQFKDLTLLKEHFYSYIQEEGKQNVDHMYLLEKERKKVGIITQARMTSSRFPGKIMLEANGKTILEHHINRLRWSGIPIYIATTDNQADLPIISLAKKLNISYYCGDEKNVLERFYKCAEKFDLDVIVRVTSDCPLIDGHIISAGLNEYLNFQDKNIYYSNCVDRTFPRGLDFEIFSFDMLKEAHLNAIAEHEREHVTPYIKESKKTNLKHYKSEENYSDLRWTLDLKEDWILLKSLFEEHKAENLGFKDVVKIVELYPKLKMINPVL